MSGTRVPFASLAALAAAASAQGEQPGTAAESAKRDLQALPTAQRPVEATAGKSLFSGTSAVTGLSLGVPATPGSSNKNRGDAAVPGKSANWLLDGVNQLEAEANVQRNAVESRNGGSKLSASAKEERQSTTATTNPFTEYLTQWLSPGDQALLNKTNRSAVSSSTAPWEISRSDFRRETAPVAAAALNPLQMELPGLADFPANRTAQNPYLAEPFQAEHPVGVPLAGIAGARETPGALPSILTPVPSTLSAVAPSPAPVEQAKPAAVVTPTERLIDDRKYFPQLRRF